MKKIIITALLAIVTLATGAQVSRFLEKGQSGIGLRLGVEKTYGTEGFFGVFSGSIKGIIDIEGAFSRDMYDQEKLELLSDNAHSSALDLSVNWWVLRKDINSSINVNLAVWADFSFANYKNYNALDTGTTAYAYKSYQEGELGFEASINFRVTETWWIQPGCYTYYAIGQEQYEELNTTSRNNYQGVGSSVNLSVIKRINKSSLYCMASQYFDSYEGSTNSYSLSIGYIFGF